MASPFELLSLPPPRLSAYLREARDDARGPSEHELAGLLEQLEALARVCERAHAARPRVDDAAGQTLRAPSPRQAFAELLIEEPPYRAARARLLAEATAGLGEAYARRHGDFGYRIEGAGRWIWVVELSAVNPYTKHQPDPIVVDSALYVPAPSAVPLVRVERRNVLDLIFGAWSREREPLPAELCVEYTVRSGADHASFLDARLCDASPHQWFAVAPRWVGFGPGMVGAGLGRRVPTAQDLAWLRTLAAIDPANEPASP
jgi:hypothetical protein